MTVEYLVLRDLYKAEQNLERASRERDGGLSTNMSISLAPNVVMTVGADAIARQKRKKGLQMVIIRNCVKNVAQR
jgi:uncharacterized membrane protein YhiD involved in acid resistance